MARPKKSADDTKTVGLRLSELAWEKLDTLAQGVGLTRSSLVEKIGLGEISIGNLPQSETQLLGKY
jgi:hypothetical protein